MPEEARDTDAAAVAQSNLGGVPRRRLWALRAIRVRGQRREGGGRGGCQAGGAGRGRQREQRMGGVAHCRGEVEPQNDVDAVDAQRNTFPQQLPPRADGPELCPAAQPRRQLQRAHEGGWRRERGYRACSCASLSCSSREGCGAVRGAAGQGAAKAESGGARGGGRRRAGRSGSGGGEEGRDAPSGGAGGCRCPHPPAPAA